MMPTNATGRVLPISFVRTASVQVSDQADRIEAILTDEDLLESIRNGDTVAALTLFRRYAKLAFSIGHRALKDEGEAEDLTQEIFLRFFTEVQTFDPTKGSARTWIVQMLYRRAFDRRAYLQRRHFYTGTDSHEYTNTLTEAKNSEDAMIDWLTARQLITIFSELSERQRKTLEAFFFEGLTFAEIAERSGEDVRNVRHHYYRGLERLRLLVRQMMRSRKIGQ